MVECLMCLCLASEKGLEAMRGTFQEGGIGLSRRTAECEVRIDCGIGKLTWGGSYYTPPRIKGKVTDQDW
jgi:hypothetical protein